MAYGGRTRCKRRKSKRTAPAAVLQRKQPRTAVDSKARRRADFLPCMSATCHLVSVLPTIRVPGNLALGHREHEEPIDPDALIKLPQKFIVRSATWDIFCKLRPTINSLLPSSVEPPPLLPLHLIPSIHF